MKTTPQQIIQLWKSFGKTFDDIFGVEPELLKEILGYQSSEQTEKQLNELTVHIHQLNSSFPDFFRTYDLEWSAFKKVYRLPMEAELQGRLLHYLLTLWHLDPKYLQNINRTIAIRYALSSKIHKISPRAILVDDCNVIAIPVHSVSAFYFQIGFLLESNQDTDTFIRDYCLKILCNQVFSDLILKYSKIIEPITSFSHSQIVFSLIQEEVPFFANTNQVKCPTDLNAYWSDLSYQTVNFGIAHELIHILKNEHLSGVTPDEFEADLFAMELLVKTNFFRPNLRFSEFKKSDILPELSALTFLLMINLQVQIEKRLIGNSGYNLSEIEQRLDRVKNIDLSFALKADHDLFRQVIKSFNALELNFSKNIDQVLEYRNQIFEIAERYVLNSNL